MTYMTHMTYITYMTYLTYVTYVSHITHMTYITYCAHIVLKGLHQATQQKILISYFRLGSLLFWENVRRFFMD